MDADTTELVKFGVALIVPALVGLGTLALSNRHNRRQAEDERRHQARLTREAATRAAIAERYDERRQAYSQLTNVAAQLGADSVQREYEGMNPPKHYLDGPELEDHFRPLVESVNNVLLIGTRGTRAAAEDLARTLEPMHGPMRDMLNLKRHSQRFVPLRVMTLALRNQRTRRLTADSNGTPFA